MNTVTSSPLIGPEDRMPVLRASRLFDLANMQERLNEAWIRVIQRYPQANLTSWVVEVAYADKIHTPPAPILVGDTIVQGPIWVRGYTSFNDRTIRVAGRTPDLVEVMAWEMCNAVRGPGQGDKGCTK
jgi:hypothetical protein